MKPAAAVIAIAEITSESGVAQAQTTLIYGEASLNRGAQAKAIEWFADKVEERSDGDLKIDLQWGALWTWRDLAIAPPTDIEYSAQERRSAAIDAWTDVALFILIVGGIYGGVCTATEAAAVSLIKNAAAVELSVVVLLLAIAAIYLLIPETMR